jgi:hypothetical protein
MIQDNTVLNSYFKGLIVCFVIVLAFSLKYYLLSLLLWSDLDQEDDNVNFSEDRPFVTEVMEKTDSCATNPEKTLCKEADEQPDHFSAFRRPVMQFFT